MPRKTKKQKIISRYRKKLQQMNTGQKNLSLSHNASAMPIIPIHTTPTQPTYVSKTHRLKTMPIPPSYTPTEYDTRLQTHTHEDLKKTLILTTVVLAFEFLIFYANLKGYL